MKNSFLVIVLKTYRYRNKIRSNIESTSKLLLGWAAKENSKKRFKSHQDLWTLQSTHSWANKRINKNKENKDMNSKTLIDRFFKLTGIRKTKVLF